jgi:small GTP-binding protein
VAYISVRRMKVCFIGSDGVGKTSLILRYTKNTFSNSYLATLGCDFYQIDFNRENEGLQTFVWDIAAQRNFERLKIEYLSFAHLTVICVDVNRISDEYIEPWISDVSHNSDAAPNYILALTKVDLIDDVSEIENIRSELEGKYNVKVIDTSAKNDYNVKELFDYIADFLWNYNP